MGPWSHLVRIILDTNNVQGLSKVEQVGLGRNLFDIKWLVTRLKVSVQSCPVGSRITFVKLASHSQGSKWWIDEDVLNKLKEGIDMEYVTAQWEAV